MRFPQFTNPWEQRKLSDLVNVNSGRDYKHLSEGDIPVYGTGGYMLSVDEALSYDRDAIGIGRKGTIDNPYILRAPFWTVDTLFYAIPQQSESLDFVYDLFQTIDWKKKDESTGVPSLSKVAINDTDVKVPSIDEQKKIGELFAGLDSTITLHQRKLDVFKKYKRGLILCLYPQKNQNTPKVRNKGFKERWIKIKLGDVLEEFTIKSSKENEYTVLSSTNTGVELRNGRVSGVSNKGYKIIDINDLVLSPQNLWLGNININHLKKGIVSPSYKTYKIHDIDIDFFEPLLHTKTMLNNYAMASVQGASIVRRNLDLDLFNAIEISVPSKEEQIIIGKTLKDLDKLIIALEKEIDLIIDYKRALLSKMFI